MPGSWSSAKQMVTTFYASVEKTPDEGDIVQMLKQAAKMQGLSLNGHSANCVASFLIKFLKGQLSLITKRQFGKSGFPR